MPCDFVCTEHVTDEIWKDVIRYEGLYQVSNLGKVRSVDRRIPNSVGSGTRLMLGKILSPSVCENPGYPSVVLSKRGKTKSFHVHYLILNAFVGPCPIGMECCHKDGNRRHSCLENIWWNTHP